MNQDPTSHRWRIGSSSPYVLSSLLTETPSYGSSTSLASATTKWQRWLGSRGLSLAFYLAGGSSEQPTKKQPQNHYLPKPQLWKVQPHLWKVGTTHPSRLTPQWRHHWVLTYPSLRSRRRTEITLISSPPVIHPVATDSCIERATSMFWQRYAQKGPKNFRRTEKT